MKNCTPFFFETLLQSEMWADMMRAGDQTRRVREQGALGIPPPTWLHMQTVHVLCMVLHGCL